MHCVSVYMTYKPDIFSFIGCVQCSGSSCMSISPKALIVYEHDNYFSHVSAAYNTDRSFISIYKHMLKGNRAENPVL